jgi:hypothetical protein
MFGFSAITDPEGVNKSKDTDAKTLRLLFAQSSIAFWKPYL